MKRCLEKASSNRFLDLAYAAVPRFIKKIDDNFVVLLSNLIPSKSKVLDIGCGTGSILGYLKTKRKDLDLYGLDSSKFMVSKAKQKNIKIKEGDARKTSFSKNYFDVVISSSLLHHIAKPKKAIYEMFRITKQQGIIVIRDLIRPDTLRDLQKIVSNRRIPYPQKLLLKNSLKAAFTLDEIRSILFDLKITDYKILKRGIRFILIIKKN